MRPHVKSLEDANLLVSTVDEDDKRRKTIGLTANGWLVRYKRAGFRT
jgi:DNA-binding MarR family transcriptional regulator